MPWSLKFADCVWLMWAGILSIPFCIFTLPSGQLHLLYWVAYRYGDSKYAWHSLGSLLAMCLSLTLTSLALENISKGAPTAAITVYTLGSCFLLLSGLPKNIFDLGSEF